MKGVGARGRRGLGPGSWVLEIPHPGRQGRRPLQSGGRKALPYILLMVLAMGCGGGELRFVDLWLTQDQQGQRAFEKGDYAAAGEHFEDPLRKGTALYLSEDFDKALAEFAKLDTAEGWFNRGNTLAHLERYEEAMEAYEPVSYTHLTLPTMIIRCRSRWSPYH